jgi:hypothetical protein
MLALGSRSDFNHETVAAFESKTWDYLAGKNFNAHFMCNVNI